MLPEYLKYWGLKKPPFSLTPDPQMLYMSRQHQEGLVRLQFAVVSNKGGALLVSENAGDGKTSLLARLRVELTDQYHGNCRTVFIDHPTLTANQMVGEIARQLGLGSGTTDKLALLNELRAFLLACHEKGEKCVVMLDEGQMLCHRPDILQELRILLNFCISDSFLLTFILSGQKPLDEAIRAMPEFYQRLPVRFFLRNLGRDDTRELIRYRLHKAGNPPGRDIFSEDGYTGIFNFSKGCPRIICSVADLALVIAHSNFSDQVDFVSVSQACSDMNRTDGAYHYFHFLKSFSSPRSVPSDPSAGAPGGTYCANCGAAMPDGSKFCPDCGHIVEAAEPAAAVGLPKTELTALDLQRQEMHAGPPGGEAVVESELIPEAPPAGNEVLPVQESSGNEASEEMEREEIAEPEAALAANPRPESGPRLGRLLRFVLEGEENIDETLTEGVANSPEKEEQATEGEYSAVEPVSQVSPGQVAERQKIPAQAENESGADLTAESVEASEQEKQLTAPDMKKSATVKCSFCGLDLPPATLECPNCGENLALQEDDEETPAAGGLEEAAKGADETREPALLAREADVRRLLERVSELSLGRYLSAGQTAGGELLRFPLRRFFGASAVIQYAATDGDDSFSARCGVAFTPSSLRIQLRRELRELPYEGLVSVTVDQLRDNGTPLLSRLVLSSGSGIYRISLPLGAELGLALCEALRAFVESRMAGADFAGGSQPSVATGEVDAGRRD